MHAARMSSSLSSKRFGAPPPFLAGNAEDQPRPVEPPTKPGWQNQTETTFGRKDAKIRYKSERHYYPADVAPLNQSARQALMNSDIIITRFFMVKDPINHVSCNAA
jgi:hypothetical protein